MLPEKYDVGTLDKGFQKAKEARSAYEPIWELNLAMYVGRQWANWVRGSLVDPVAPAHRKLIVDNRIGPAVLTKLARMTKQQPVFTATPRSAGDAEAESARLAESALTIYWDTNNLGDRLFQALLWSQVVCAGFWKITWDGSLGDSFEAIVGPDGQPVRDSTGQLAPPELADVIPGITRKTIARGEVVVDVRSPFQIVPDPLAERLADCGYLYEETIQSPDYIQRRYGVKVEPDADGHPNIPGALVAAAAGSNTARGVRVRELWLRPNMTHKGGKHIVWVKGKILVDQDNPYGELPYVMFGALQVPGRFWPTSMVEQMKPLQQHLNKIKSQIAENAARLGNPAVMLPRSGDVDYYGIPGEVITYNDMNPGAIPQFLTPPPMPGYVLQEIDRIEAAMREVSGQHEISSGNVPSGVTAASAINLLLEQDDTRLGPQIYEMERAIGTAGGMLIRIMGRNYTDERVLRAIGQDGSFDTTVVRGELLKGVDRVDVQAGSQMPASKAAKQAAMAQVFQLAVQNGLPLDPYGLQVFMRDYQVGGLENLFGSISDDLQQTNREHRRLYSGDDFPCNQFDNHPFHLEAHANEQKTARYEQADEETKRRFMAHVQTHIAATAPPPQPQIGPDGQPMPPMDGAGMIVPQPNGQAPGPQDPSMPVSGNGDVAAATQAALMAPGPPGVAGPPVS